MKIALMGCAVVGAIAWIVNGYVPWGALTAVIAVVGVLLCWEYES